MKKKKSISWAITTVTILLHLLACVYLVTCVKAGVHSDEMYSFGAANSYYQPMFTYDIGVGPLYGEPEDRANRVVNYREWVSGKAVRDFLTVQKEERFTYDSVFFNASVDFHPPLYYLLLHTLMSFFPDAYSLWFGYVLSFIFLVITDIYLYKSMKMLTNKYTAIASVIMYAFSSGGLMTYILIRQYSLMTALLAMFFYHNIRVFKSKDLSSKDIVPIFLISFLMFMTNYPIIVAFGAFTALVCVYYLIKKKIKNMFIYGLTELGALVLMIITVPASIMDQVNKYDPAEHPYDYITQFRLIVHYTLAFVVGIPVSYFRDASEKIIPVVIICIILFTIPLCYLFRNEEWFKKTLVFLKRHFFRIYRKINSSILIIMFFVAFGITYILVLAKVLNIDNTQISAVRYVFPLYPVVSMIVTYLIYKFVSSVPKGRRAAIAVCVAVALFTNVYTNLSYKPRFLYKVKGEILNVSNITANKNVVLVIPGAKSLEHSEVYDIKDKHDSFVSIYYFNDLYKTNNLFITSFYNLKNDISGINYKHVDYLLIPLDFYKISDEENVRFGLKSEEETKDLDMQVVYEDEEAEEEKNEQKYMNSVVNQINGGCNPELIYVLHNQDLPVGVFKISND